ncbi:MAG: metal-dependent hydrolase [Flavobacteriales bacterium CG18_big_fil_WC_8_21_14_2_50_32_9]|nr:cyclase family protein [Flavobacteriales bacterium]PIQ14679.1 MAG: metal-dependent hydrolase [Flavobacteriales bacterium CG18_big_fil_WC_8_21_14_2_50_32_9]
MITTITHQGKKYNVDLSQPIDISLPLSNTPENITAWYVSKPEFTPVMENGFVGDVNLGGAVNFRNIFFNPHGHGTHTECVGHISKEPYTINQCLKHFFFLADVISIVPEKIENDSVITLKQIKQLWQPTDTEAIIFRTLPNDEAKKTMQYSNTNPTYIEEDAVLFLTKNGINHLLIDSPSIDKEEDGGALKAHHAFWEYPQNTQAHRTISELIFVADSILDGKYLLNIQIASFESDASPSKPVLYALI